MAGWKCEMSTHDGEGGRIIMTNFSRIQKLRNFGRSMIALQIAVDVLMDLTIVHSRAPGDPRASHCRLLLLADHINDISVFFPEF